MKFRTWFENDENATASAAVQNTGLQPQVDAENIDTRQKRDSDKISAIDAGIERLNVELPDGDSEDPKVNKFKELWDKFKEKWENLKVSDYDGEEEEMEDDPDELGQNMGDPKFRQQMTEKPNMTPAPPQPASSPGMMGG